MNSKYRRLLKRAPDALQQIMAALSPDAELLSFEHSGMCHWRAKVKLLGKNYFIYYDRGFVDMSEFCGGRKYTRIRLPESGRFNDNLEEVCDFLKRRPLVLNSA